MSRIETLAVDDVRALSAAIGHLRSPHAHEDFPAVALEVVADMVRADIWSWNEVDPRLAHPLVHSLPPRGQDDARQHRLQRFGELADQHPVISYATATGDGSARRISDFLDTEEFHALDLYREVYVGEHVEHQIAVTLPSVLPRIVGIAGSRATLGDDFDERDRLVLDLLRPHLAQSYELVRDRERIRSMLATAVAGLEATGTQVVVLAPVPYEVTPGAMATMYAAFGAPQPHDPLPRRVASWLTRERSTEKGADGLPAVRRPLVAERHGRRVVARLVPGATDDDVVLLRLENLADQPTALRSLGLTGREAEVIALVAQGHTNATIAGLLAVEPSTVKTHLENSYRKLGVRSRAAAVAMALDLLAT